VADDGHLWSNINKLAKNKQKKTLNRHSNPTLNVFALGTPYAQQCLFFLPFNFLMLLGLQASEAGFGIKW
jgi:hypothetical protein